MNSGIILKSFLIYGFLGWVVENVKNYNVPYISCTPALKYIFKGDICVTPFMFAYGFAGIFIGYLFSKYPNLSWISRIILFVIIFNIIELVIGYSGEKILCKRIDTCDRGHKMWDYKNTTNLNGYIDIEHSFYWALLGVAGYFIYPYLIKIPNCKLIIYAIMIWIVITIFKFPKKK